MGANNRSAIVISASSDIGAAMCQRWKKNGWDVSGTYRTKSKTVDEMSSLGVKLVQCDLSDRKSIYKACSDLKYLCPSWDVLVLCPGAQEPVGPFMQCVFEEWEKSIQINFTGQQLIVHELLSNRRVEPILGPCVLFFAGGGTNSATLNYSAYTISKIGLIKMCELLDAEIADTRFVVVGPGWVKTKIHKATLNAGMNAGENYYKTIDKLKGDECTSIERVVDCFDWIISMPRKVVSGRNFSVVFDKWGTKELEEKLLEEENIYKLRRHGNDVLV